jgi:PBP1b-binding outer membrane lipoprotein LpoB
MFSTTTKTFALISALALLVSGCGFPDNAQEKAQMFFDEGSEKIVDSLEDQDVGEDKIAEVEQILSDHEDRVVSKLREYMDQQKDSLKSVYTGQNTDALIASAESAHEAQLAARRSIGAMHADIEAAVGSETWAAANEQRRKEFEDKFEDED